MNCGLSFGHWQNGGTPYLPSKSLRKIYTNCLSVCVNESLQLNMKYKALIFEELFKEISAFFVPENLHFQRIRKRVSIPCPTFKNALQRRKNAKIAPKQYHFEAPDKVSGVSFLRNFQKRVSGCPFSVQTSERIFQNRVSFRSVNSKYMRRIFEKHPPEMLSRFKQVKGNFPKYPYFFFAQFKQVKGIFFGSGFWVSKTYPFVLMSERNKK